MTKNIFFLSKFSEFFCFAIFKNGSKNFASDRYISINYKKIFQNYQLPIYKIVNFAIFQYKIELKTCEDWFLIVDC